MKYFVYVIRSDVDGRLYKGLSKDVNQRLVWHNQGKTRSTKGYRPWKLIYTEELLSLEDAREREKYFKSGQGREELKILIRLRSSAE
ncbi:GIY-YIG nuclease family protein [Nonlabens sp. Ci31]|nr:GIY-YIG nuclease family protein [Nonlabens sp. Ci31]QJP34402.1 GIY-YIG nuclease family protein [Nonlabens sp. Ci31]